MSILVGLFFTIGTYLILSKNMLRIILGTSVISHGINLLIMTMGGLKNGISPIIKRENPLIYRCYTTSIDTNSHCHKFCCDSSFISVKLQNI